MIVIKTNTSAAIHILRKVAPIRSVNNRNDLTQSIACSNSDISLRVGSNQNMVTTCCFDSSIASYTKKKNHKLPEMLCIWSNLVVVEWSIRHPRCYTPLHESRSGHLDQTHVHILLDHKPHSANVLNWMQSNMATNTQTEHQRHDNIITLPMRQKHLVRRVVLEPADKLLLAGRGQPHEHLPCGPLHHTHTSTSTHKLPRWGLDGHASLGHHPEHLGCMLLYTVIGAIQRRRRGSTGTVRANAAHRNGLFLQWE